MRKNSNLKGFTLIELLVVVAIVAILASVIVASLNRAKTKGEDSAIASNLHTATNQAELFFADNGNSYLPAGGSVFGVAACPSYDPNGTNMLSKDKILADAIVQATLVGNGNACANSNNAWAIAVGMKFEPGNSWCVDSTGSSKKVAGAPLAAIDPVTLHCN